MECLALAVRCRATVNRLEGYRGRSIRGLQGRCERSRWWMDCSLVLDHGLPTFQVVVELSGTRSYRVGLSCQNRESLLEDIDSAYLSNLIVGDRLSRNHSLRSSRKDESVVILRNLDLTLLNPELTDSATVG